MANVTDASFRRIIAKYGRPDVTWTEFVSCEGLLSEGREKLLMDFWYSESERPIVAQIFGAKPEQFYQIAHLCQELKFDGIDINMGCPDKGLVKGGSCAALIQTPELAQKIISETKRGAGPLPVSVKTRIGFNKNEIEEWVPALLGTGIAALTMHLRTRKELSLVPAHWELMTSIVALRNQHSPATVLLGNGDVKDIAEARSKVEQYGIDGVMLGRGIFGNPWLFAEKNPSIEERLRVAVEHTKLFAELYSSVIPAKAGIQWTKPFDLMKKHFKAYINGFDGAKELRVNMMGAETSEEIETIVKEFLK